MVCTGLVPSSHSVHPRPECQGHTAQPDRGMYSQTSTSTTHLVSSQGAWCFHAQFSSVQQLWVTILWQAYHGLHGAI